MNRQQCDWQKATHVTALQWTKEPVPECAALLAKDQLISDELLLSLNPEWRRIKETFSPGKKNQLLHDAVMPFWFKSKGSTPQMYHGMRNFIALAICIGADPTNIRPVSLLSLSLESRDVPLTRYLLEKKVDPNWGIYGEDLLLLEATTCELAALLIDYGAKIPDNILKHCTFLQHDPELLQFYLDRGIPPKTDLWQWTLLHEVVDSDTFYGNMIPRMRIALKTGIDVAHQNLDRNTALHFAARHKNPSLELINNVLIGHYAEEHAGFIQFLMYLKRNYRSLYAPTDLRKKFFTGPSPLGKIHELLEKRGKIKNKVGLYENQTAYELCQDRAQNPDPLLLDALNPEKWTYATYLRIKLALSRKLQRTAKIKNLRAVANEVSE